MSRNSCPECKGYAPLDPIKDKQICSECGHILTESEACPCWPCSNCDYAADCHENEAKKVSVEEVIIDGPTQ